MLFDDLNVNFEQIPGTTGSGNRFPGAGFPFSEVSEIVADGIYAVEYRYRHGSSQTADAESDGNDT